MTKFFIVIIGPTGVGKTEFADKLSSILNIKSEILNADLGQFYTKLSIGTAKPDLTNKNNYSLFNILDEPKDFTVNDFNKIIIKKLNKLWEQDILPIIVGGSCFYVKSIFFKYINYNYNISNNTKVDYENYDTETLYELLKSIDILRANKINKNDRYRIERALNLWYNTNQKPSSLEPEFNMPGHSCIVIHLNRDRQELYNLINQRVINMLNQGWIDEVKNLNNNWKEFLTKKKLIGYPDIIDYLNNNFKDINKLILNISQKTRRYAKKQIIFWRSLKKFLQQKNKNNNLVIEELNLQELEINNIAKKILDHYELK